MGITVHNQTAGGAINNVEGTQNVYGSQSGSVTLGDVQFAVRSLDEALTTTPMPEDARRAARDRVRAIDEEVNRPQPDRERVADHLAGLSKVLASAGSVMNAGSALVGPLKTLASWLGPLAAPVLALLPL